MKSLKEFLQAVDESGMSALKRAKAALWYAGHDDIANGLAIGEICSAIEEAGHPRQNPSRLKEQLAGDKADVSLVPGSKAWRLKPNCRSSLNAIYEPILGAQPKPRATDSVLPRELFAGTRGYIEKVIYQINASYDTTLYDCTAVMCRRLLETLIIEVYEAVGRPNDIKRGDNFFMLADLLGVFEKDPAFQLSRNTKKGLQDFKKLGDQSAHNRRFNAQKDDIDRIRDGLRVASEELLHLSGLAKTTSPKA